MNFNALAKADYFDGNVPVARPVLPMVVGGNLEFDIDEKTTIRWPVSEVRQLPDKVAANDATLRWTGDPVARLIVTDHNILASLPNLHRSSPPKGRGKLAAWAIAAIAAVALQVGVLVPLLADNLAEFIPPAGERALGEATFGQIRKALAETNIDAIPLCEAPNGLAALDGLIEKLTAGQAFPQEITVFVLDHEMVNAFALPGGFVVLFDGLIQAANGPDEVAAVLGHEVGHVISRDPTRHALRSAGSIGVLGLLFGDFAGGAAVLFLTERLISAQYSQDAETRADAFAYGLLGTAGISPGALGDMFEQMRSTGQEDDRGVVAHFLSHPAMGDRIAASRNAVDPAADYVASMTGEEWAALKAICG